LYDNGKYNFEWKNKRVIHTDYSFI
jgi:hypothetical protein